MTIILFAISHPNLSTLQFIWIANWVGTQRLKFQNRQLQLQKSNNGVADGDDEVISSDEDENLDAALDEETRKKNKAKRKVRAEVLSAIITFVLLTSELIPEEIQAIG